MTDLTVTATSVSVLSGDVTLGIAGEAITTGQLCYLNDTDGKWYKALCTGTALQAGSAGLGMALGTAAAANARIGIAKTGAIVQSSAVAAGVVYYVSTNAAGGLSPAGDLTATDKIVPAAMSLTGNQLMLIRDYHAGAVL